MAILAEKPQQFLRFPEGKEMLPEGPVLLQIAQVEDLGIVKTNFNGEEKEEHRVRFLYEQSGGNGALFQDYKLSMNEKANLFKVVKGVLGTVPPLPYDIEQLRGRFTKALVVHETSSKGNDFAKIVSLKPATESAQTANKAPASKSQAKAQAKTVPPVLAAAAEGLQITDDDIPF